MRIETYPLSNQRVCKQTMAKVWRRVSGLKNQANKRMSALNNATNLAIAQGGDALNKEGVLETSKKFLEFLGC